ncbi:nucleotidyl transferase AbiEii/AbiGii toxin family protein [Curtobacterium sp. VKM Ac-2922]|uniref:nucleotidyl transferase AbiEii/AbiGii toxin family protein n=1 Tax=Curtobacterium sp. VKM Ac-2922 TaxID=2929475 RepID=UPI001FB41C43|nr:nucleotidyl transferase AbiEii/AbiGii toxin family protein [Curtobacterium sp. VKM Ac-2922]MCJ1714461.1 nucleotidyl transferase AbiEii/AbiGii toxin family protein [Curtobacterium sp. VKM Ac-2922]
MAEEGYGSWTAIASAIKASAQRARAESATNQDVGALIAQARLDRFLSRVFSDGERSEWLLKGGGAMLARVLHTRATKDVDLASSSGDLDEAQLALERAAGQQLDDHLRFELTTARATGRGDNQPGVQTRRLLFSCFDVQTGRKVGEVPVDVVVGPAPVGTVETVTPANRLPLPRDLPAPQYRLFPVADQVAEKVCATLQDYDGKPSSRVKDLVDLVTIARTQQISMHELHAAIEHKRRQTNLDPIRTFAVPEGWDRQYRTLAAATPSAGGITDVHEAEEFVRTLIDPALDGDSEQTWCPGHGWHEAGEVPATEKSTDDRSVHVDAHVRSGHPGSEHHRGRRVSGA